MLLSWFGPLAISLVLVAATALARTAAGKNFGKPQLLQHNAHRHVTTHALHLLKLAQGTSQRARSLTFTRSRGVGNGKYPDPTTGKVVPCLRKSHSDLVQTSARRSALHTKLIAMPCGHATSYLAWPCKPAMLHSPTIAATLVAEQSAALEVDCKIEHEPA